MLALWRLQNCTLTVPLDRNILTVTKLQNHSEKKKCLFNHRMYSAPVDPKLDTNFNMNDWPNQIFRYRNGFTLHTHSLDNYKVDDSPAWQLHIADYILQITYYRLCITDYMLQITNCRLHVAYIADYILQITYRGLHTAYYVLRITYCGLYILRITYWTLHNADYVLRIIYCRLHIADYI